MKEISQKKRKRYLSGSGFLSKGDFVRIDFEELYGETPIICRKCFADCSECIYEGDIFILAEIDRLNAQKKLREQAIKYHTSELKKIEEQLERYKQSPARAGMKRVIEYD